jgi:prolyl oligopeptidase
VRRALAVNCGNNREPPRATLRRFPFALAGNARGLLHGSGGLDRSTHERFQPSTIARRSASRLSLRAIVSAAPDARSGHPGYPVTATADIVDDYHGRRVADPYRWLEDLGSADTRAWIDAQNAVTLPYIDELPQRAPLVSRLTELWNYPRTGLPYRVAGQLFYQHNTGLQQQAPLYCRGSLSDAPQLLLDPNTLSTDGSISLAQWMPSPDGRYLAYALSQGGADWADVQVRDLSTGADLPGIVHWFRFSSISWTKDGKGFFYARFPEPPSGKALEADLQDHQLWYHRVGTPQEEDQLIYWRRELPRYFIGGSVSDDGRYLTIGLYNGTDRRNRLFYADLGDPMHPRIDAPIVAILDEDVAELTVLGNDGPTFYVRTDLEAPKRRIVAIDPRDARGPAGWTSVVPESPNALESAHLAGSLLFCHYLVDVASEVHIRSLDGGEQGTLDLPGISSVQGMSGHADIAELFYAVTSPLLSPTVYHYDIAARCSIPIEPANPAFDPSAYETRRVFYASKDGTRIPMFITARKGLVRDGMNPAWLYGYGGFAISVAPAYRLSLPAWLEMGGIFAQAALRGGAEYGEDWHRAGKFEKKQNVFDDFIAAAEYLVREKYTVPEKLVIEGRSNGGLLVGAVMTQRPELFAVAIPQVGVLDMLRYDHFTGGAAWAVEYGTARNEADFAYLIRYSPLHNVRLGTCYPATLVVTADHDDRVVPSHSYKFVATLQAAQGCAKPVLIRVERQASHGYSPTDKQIAERADVLAFAASRLGIGLPTP